MSERSLSRILRERPLVDAAILLICLILLLRAAGSLPGKRDLSEADSRSLTLAGRVADFGFTSGGREVFLDRVTFLSDEKSSEIYRSAVNTMNREIRSRDRVVLFLDEDESADPLEFRLGGRSLSIGDDLTVHGKCFLPSPPTNPGQFDTVFYDLTRRVVLRMSGLSLLTGEDGRSRTAGSDADSDENRDKADTAVHSKGSRDQLITGYKAHRSISERFRDFLWRMRLRLRLSASLVFGDDSALIHSIVLGDKSGLPQEMKRLYQNGGIAHILAISSLHITMLGKSLYEFLRKRRCSFQLSALLSAFLVISFCVMTGNSVSAQRASVMFCVWLGSQIAGRTSDRLSSLSLAAVIILLRQPWSLWDSSFLLSFSCILTIEFLPDTIKLFLRMLRAGSRSMEKMRQRERRSGKVRQKAHRDSSIVGGYLREVLSSSLISSAALQIGTLPIVLYFFSQMEPFSFLTNMAVLPCMGLLMFFSLLGCCIGTLSVPLGVLFQSPCHVLLTLFRMLCRMEEQLPGAVLICGRPGLWKVIVYYLTVAGMTIWIRLAAAGGAEKISGRHGHPEERMITAGQRKTRPISPSAMKIFCPLLTASVILLVMIHPHPKLRVTVLDVGQGDCILLEEGGRAYLVDAGSSSEEKIWRLKIESCLKYYGIPQLEAVFVTHGDEDHRSGLIEMLDSYEPGFRGCNAGGISVKKIIFPDLDYADERLRETAEMANLLGIPVMMIDNGDRIGPFSCLSPDSDCMTGDANQDCLVLLFQEDQFRMLLTGDIEKDGEDSFVRRNQGNPLLSDIDVLKVGHHGSANATSAGLLDLTHPSMAVISCGRNNRYGFPKKEVLERLKAAGADIHRTDREGAVQIEGQ